ncbi:hypothetical protein ACEQ8H_002048 [Pleosporales sp. CAS-2024a]
MHPSNILASILFAFAATAYATPEPVFHTLEVRKDHNGTKQHDGKDSTKKECATIRKLTMLANLASNQTKLDALMANGKLDAQKMADLKTKAANANTMLMTLTANTTLTSDCAVIDASEKTKSECKEMKVLSKLAQLASNTTALDALAAKKKMNSTMVDMFKTKLQKAETKLKDMQANTTLTNICNSLQQGKAKADGTSSAGSSGTSAAPAKETKSAANELRAQSFLVVSTFVAIFFTLL